MPSGFGRIPGPASVTQRRFWKGFRDILTTYPSVPRVKHPGQMLAFLIRFLSFFALCLWVGGGAAISFLAAPVIFEKAGSRRLAGLIGGEILQRVYTGAIGAGPSGLVGGGGRKEDGRGGSERGGGGRARGGG